VSSIGNSRQRRELASGITRLRAAVGISVREIGHCISGQPRRRGLRPVVRPWLVAGAAALAAAGITSATYEVVSEARDRRRFPAPGRLVDVGGRRLHLMDAGAGSPVVVIVPAIGGNVLDWLAFQRELAKNVRVCVYDRAGYGWSGPPAGRQTFDDKADDLRQGLRAAGIFPPYVLVGHSVGGIIARRFAVRYPGDVAGMALVDSSHEDQGRRLRAEGFWSRGTAVLLWFAIRGRLRILGLRRLAVAAGRSQLTAWIARDIPAEFAGAARAINLTARHRRTAVGEIMLMARSHDQPPSLGALPLTVLTAAGQDPTWMALQAGLAGISAASVHTVASRGGHNLHTDAPDLVVSAIRDLLSRIQEAAR
jgi:pimeloyl-ACP methyl ester carboxylesterase